eukprot:scaffold69711_cov74-Phaeocystis_antarctica.AAC.3
MSASLSLHVPRPHLVPSPIRPTPRSSASHPPHPWQSALLAAARRLAGVAACCTRAPPGCPHPPSPRTRRPAAGSARKASYACELHRRSSRREQGATPPQPRGATTPLSIDYHPSAPSPRQPRTLWAATRGWLGSPARRQHDRRSLASRLSLATDSSSEISSRWRTAVSVPLTEETSVTSRPAQRSVSSAGSRGMAAHAPSSLSSTASCASYILTPYTTSHSSLNSRPLCRPICGWAGEEEVAAHVSLDENRAALLPARCRRTHPHHFHVNWPPSPFERVEHCQRVRRHTPCALVGAAHRLGAIVAEGGAVGLAFVVPPDRHHDVLPIARHGVDDPLLAHQILLKQHGRHVRRGRLVEGRRRREHSLEAARRLLRAAGEPHAQRRRAAPRLEHRGKGFRQPLQECGGLAPLARGGLLGCVQAATAEHVTHQKLVATRAKQPVRASRYQRVYHALTALEPGVAAAQHIDHVHALQPLGPSLLLARRRFQRSPDLLSLVSRGVRTRT